VQMAPALVGQHLWAVVGGVILAGLAVWATLRRKKNGEHRKSPN
jgi:LPXTG-motif cell wall-anchored protein